mgnify:CR=1 FL=1
MNLETARQKTAAGAAFAGKARRSVGHAADLSDDGVDRDRDGARQRQQGPLAGRRRRRRRARLASSITLHDDAWVRELGGFGPDDPSFGFLADQKRLWFLSERDGWMHLYTSSTRSRVWRRRAAADARASGRYRHRDLSLDRKTVLLHQHRSSSRRAPALRDAGRRRRAHQADVDDRRQRRRRLARRHDHRPDLLVHSNKPHEVYVMPNQPGAPAKQVTTTPTDEWRSFKWVDPQLITYKTRDGVDGLRAAVHAGDDRREARSAAPAVVFVHGAGYAQNAHSYWASYYREYMFHNLLASRGLRRARSGLPRELGLRPRLAHGDLPPHGRQGSRTTSSTARSSWSTRRR